MPVAADAPTSERTASLRGTAKGISLAGLARAATRSRVVLAAIWLATILHLAIVCYRLPGRADRPDFSHYYASALAARTGLDPYTLDLKAYAARFGLNVGNNIRATYTPTFILCFEPLTLLSPRAAYWTWFGINVVFLAVALGMLIGSEPALDAGMKSALVAFALLYPPLEVHFYYAQSQIMVLMMLVVMMRTLEDGNDALAGLILAAAGLLRGFPLIMAGYLVVRQRWRALAYTAGGVAAGGAVTMLAMGPARAIGFDHAISLISSLRFIAVPANIALRSFVSRLFWYAWAVGLGRVFLVLCLPVAIAADLILLALTAKATFAPRRGAIRDRPGFALWVAATTLLAPTAWIHYMVLLFIPFVLMAAAGASVGLDRRAARAAVASYLGLAIAMIVVPALPTSTPVWIRQGTEEYASVSLLLAYLAVYWFAAGGAGTH